MTSLLLKGATLADGSVVDIRCDGGLITEVGPTLPPKSQENETVEDLDGYLVVPAPVEPHAHLDKALTADRVANPAGDLFGAITAWRAYRGGLDVDDIAARAKAAALSGLAKGTTAIRTHVDVGEGIDLRALEAVDKVRADLAGLIDIQIVALGSLPLTGVAGADSRAIMSAALETPGMVDLVGGAPHGDPDPEGALDFCLSLAVDSNLPVDLHTDETLDPASVGLADLARRVAEGFPGAATASHCVSLGVQPEETQAAVASDLAAGKVGVVTLPQTNLYLQGRQYPCSTPRGLTAVRRLMDAGVTVAGGGDNVQDPFNPLGRADALETAGLLVAAAHLRPAEAYESVSTAARKVMGLPAVEVAAGFPAELLAIRAASIGEALARATEDRVVIHDGRVVARTSVTSQLLT
jgi:cytosine deaminase